MILMMMAKYRKGEKKHEGLTAAEVGKDYVNIGSVVRVSIEKRKKKNLNKCQPQ